MSAERASQGSDTRSHIWAPLSPSLEIFQTRLDAVLCSLLWVTLLGQGVGLGDPQRSLPTLTMLGFGDQKHTKGSPRWSGFGFAMDLRRSGLSLCSSHVLLPQTLGVPSPAPRSNPSVSRLSALRSPVAGVGSTGCSEATAAAGEHGAEGWAPALPDGERKMYFHCHEEGDSPGKRGVGVHQGPSPWLPWLLPVCLEVAETRERKACCHDWQGLVIHHSVAYGLMPV